MAEKTSLADLNAAAPAESESKRQKMDDTFQKTTLAEFEAVFPKLEADILEHAQKYKLPKAELEWFKAVSPNCISSGPFGLFALFCTIA